MPHRRSRKTQPPLKHFHPAQGWFALAAGKVAQLAGRPATFLIATSAVVLWAVSGPLFGYSETWQLLINTSTTIITFLMVFLIQNTQNRDTTALQIKLDALIFATRGTGNELAAAENFSDEELETLHRDYSERAKQTRTALKHRRTPKSRHKKS